MGTVSGLSLSGSHVLVQFTVQNGVRLGDRTNASAKVLTPLGQEYLDLEPAGKGEMAAGAVIPQSRTHETQTIVSTIRAGANVVQGINLQQLVQAMAVTNQDLEAVPPGATSALLKGLSQLSDVIALALGRAGAARAERLAADGNVAPARHAAVLADRAERPRAAGPQPARTQRSTSC